MRNGALSAGSKPGAQRGLSLRLRSAPLWPLPPHHRPPQAWGRPRWWPRARRRTLITDKDRSEQSGAPHVDVSSRLRPRPVSPLGEVVLAGRSARSEITGAGHVSDAAIGKLQGIGDRVHAGDRSTGTVHRRFPIRADEARWVGDRGRCSDHRQDGRCCARRRQQPSGSCSCRARHFASLSLLAAVGVNTTRR